MRALLRRRAGPGARPDVLRVQDVEADVSARVVRRGGEPIVLSPMAFDLLVALVRRGGAVASRFELLREVWGYKAEVVSRTVDAHVAEIRRRLGDRGTGSDVNVTVWKAGYRAHV